MFDSKDIQIYGSREELRSQLATLAQDYLDLKDVDLYNTSYVSYLINVLSVLSSNLTFFNSSIYKDFFMTLSQMPESVNELSSWIGYTVPKANSANVDILFKIPLDFNDSTVSFYLPENLKVYAGNVPYLITSKYKFYTTSENINNVSANPGSNITILRNELVTVRDSSGFFYPVQITFNNNGSKTASFMLPFTQVEPSYYNFQIPSTLEFYQFYTKKLTNVGGQISSLNVYVFDSLNDADKQKLLDVASVDEFVALIDSSNTSGIQNASSYLWNESSAGIYTLSQNDRSYTWAAINNDVEIYFGNGVIGAQPTQNSIVCVVANLTKGSSGNVIAGSITTGDTIYYQRSTTQSIEKIKYSVINPASAYGGTDAPSISEIKSKAINNLRSKDRLVSSDDYNNFNSILTNIPLEGSLPILKRSDLKVNEICLFSKLVYTNPISNMDEVVPTRNITFPVYIKPTDSLYLAPVNLASTSHIPELYGDLNTPVGYELLGQLKYATTSNLSSLSGLDNIDGQIITPGDIVLVKNQTNVDQNGIYTISSGQWVRTIPVLNCTNKYITIKYGTENNGTTWYYSADNRWHLSSLIDGQSISLTGRNIYVLVKNQINTSDNGVYLVKANAQWERVYETNSINTIWLPYNSSSSNNNYVNKYVTIISGDESQSAQYICDNNNTWRILYNSYVPCNSYPEILNGSTNSNGFETMFDLVLDADTLTANYEYSVTNVTETTYANSINTNLNQIVYFSIPSVTIKALGRINKKIMFTANISNLASQEIGAPTEFKVELIDFNGVSYEMALTKNSDGLYESATYTYDSMSRFLIGTNDYTCRVYANVDNNYVAVCDYKFSTVVRRPLNDFMISSMTKSADGKYYIIHDVPVILTEYLDMLDANSDTPNTGRSDFELIAIQKLISNISVSSKKMLTDFINIKFPDTYGKIDNMKYNPVTNSKINIVTNTLSIIPDTSTLVPGTGYLVNGYEKTDISSNEYPWKDYVNQLRIWNGANWYNISPTTGYCIKIGDMTLIYTGHKWIEPIFDVPLVIKLEVEKDSSVSISNDALVSNIKTALLDSFSSRFGMNVNIDRSEIVQVARNVSGVQYCNIIEPFIDVRFKYDISSLSYSNLIDYTPQLVAFVSSSIDVKILET